MLTARLPAHLLSLVDAGVIRVAHARAVVAYQADCAQADAFGRPADKRALHRRRGEPDEDGYVQDSRHARDRAERARYRLGEARNKIVRRVGFRALTFQDAAAELRYERWEDVKVQFAFACGDLLAVYSEVAEAA